MVPQAAVLVLILVAIGIRRNMPGGILPVVQNGLLRRHR